MSDVVTRLNAALEGRYRVDGELGQGGMATVYLASDLKHNRKVALKVLKPELAAVLGAQRFLAEIETTANLQHPHILPLFDSGEADGFLFYVMPYVEGESLRDRLDREHQLSVEDALRIATDGADALDYAHRQGVIHRDIKPANILLRDGRPMISDFGIALAVGEAGGGRLTETGLSLGTPHYMSPEQATGDLTVGAATDVYALGCVVYEMLVGEPPYTGGTAQAILGKIVVGKLASAREHRRSVPEHVDAAIRKALEKVPADRYAGARHFARALGDVGFRHGGAQSRADHAGARWNRLSVTLAATTVALAALAGWSLYGRAPGSPIATGEVRFGIPMGVGVDRPPESAAPHFDRSARTEVAFSRDGNRLVYNDPHGPGGAGDQLYMHRLDGERAELIEAPGRNSFPFFSPGGEWLAFVNVSEGGTSSLKRYSVTDGTVETIAEGLPPAENSGATWGDDGTIVMGGPRSFYRVAATGGAWELLFRADSLSVDRSFQPHLLPGSRTLLFHRVEGRDYAQAEIVALDLASQTQRTVLTNAMDPHYLPTGHLLFMRQGTLLAVGFDVERVEVIGQPVIMVEDVMQSLYGPNSGFETGAGQVAVSAAGHLAYVRGGVFPENTRRAVRITSTSDTVRLDMEPRPFIQFLVSPDGNQIASIGGRGQGTEIWIHDLGRGVNRLLNTGGIANWPAAWSPDSEWIAFSSDRDGGASRIYRLRADNTGEPDPFVPSEAGQQIVSSWSSQGVLAWLQGGGIWVMPPDGDPRPFLESESFLGYPTFSPDGAWIAYVSGESGQREVYVRPYPGPGRATLISPAGGVSPAWSRDGRQLFYIPLATRSMMVVNVVPGDPFVADRPRTLFERWRGPFVPVRGYDVFQDGSFVTSIAEDVEATSELPTEVRVILNFFDAIRARLPN